MRRLLLVVLWVLLAAPVARGETFERAAVAADHPLASEAGAEMLRRGGNAVDAAVASAFALSVVTPYASGIGGGGFMLIALPDDPRTEAEGDALRLAIDFRETAPAATDPEAIAETHPSAVRDGGLAVATPGAVAGLLSALERFGTLDRATVLAPAIAYAEDGFEVSKDYAGTARDLRRWYRGNIERQETYSFVWTELIGEGEIEAGARLRNPAKARALRLIAEEGAGAFYKGEIGERIVAAVQRDGGTLTMADLAAYEPVDREPLVGTFSGRTVLTMPPPSSGGVATVQILGLLERYAGGRLINLRELEHNSVAWMHALSEAFKHAFADRNAFLGDADHADVPWETLITEAHLDRLAARTSDERAMRAAEYGMPGASAAPGNDDAGTSHVSVVDSSGGAAAATLTINTAFGSKLAAPEFGFVLNNQMDDFTTRPGRANAFGLRQSEANAPAAGKRPLSSMSPTIVLSADGEVELVTGASGGPRIITATAQSILNALVFDMSAEEAVVAPRVHDQLWPPALYMEPEWDLSMGVDPEDVAAVQKWMRTSKRNERMRFELTGMGHSLRRMEEVGAVQLIKRTEGGWQAASDPRKGGAPAGLD